MGKDKTDGSFHAEDSWPNEPGLSLNDGRPGRVA